MDAGETKGDVLGDRITGTFLNLRDEEGTPRLGSTGDTVPIVTLVPFRPLFGFASRDVGRTADEGLWLRVIISVTERYHVAIGCLADHSVFPSVFS